MTNEYHIVAIDEEYHTEYVDTCRDFQSARDLLNEVTNFFNKHKNTISFDVIDNEVPSCLNNDFIKDIVNYSFNYKFGILET